MYLHIYVYVYIYIYIYIYICTHTHTCINTPICMSPISWRRFSHTQESQACWPFSYNQALQFTCWQLLLMSI